MLFIEVETEFSTNDFLDIAADEAIVAGVANDACSNPEPISGLGPFFFDLVGLTTSGPSHAACTFSSQSNIANDEWFCWTAPMEQCAGQFVASTCGGTGVDTKIAVYNGCACPTTSTQPLSCSDDDCGLQTHATFTAVPGQSYLIRLGMFPGSTDGPGLGTWSIECLPPQPCERETKSCQSRSPVEALNSNRRGFKVADDFRPATNGNISSLCWWGAYSNDLVGGDCQGIAPDAFEVRYYQSNQGIPGSQIAFFSQALGTLTVDGPAFTGIEFPNGIPEYEFTATHAAVPVVAGTCYWVEISNNVSNCSWFWETALPPGFSPFANDRAFQDGLYVSPPNGYGADEVACQTDLAYCLDVPLSDAGACLPPAPTNNACSAAPSLNTEQVVFFDNTSATLDGPSHSACMFAGQSQIDRDVWYKWTAPCSGEVFVRTCEMTDADSRIAVYSGCTCPASDARLLKCNDDFCGDDGLQSMVIFEAVAGSCYLIRVGTFPGEPGCAGRFEISCGPPENAACGLSGALSCFVEHPDAPQPGCSGAPGCADESCCEAVCACDSFCCECEWDENCAGTGFLGSGCGAATLCATCGSPTAGDCCTPHATPFCSDAACCQAVCACDGFCCGDMGGTWDEFCAGTGDGAGGACAATTLCADLCALTCPAGSASFVNPQSGSLDASRPHPPNSALPRLGLSLIQALAPVGADDGCWQLCEPPPPTGTPANGIFDVVEQSGNYAIALNRPTSPRAMTTLRYTDMNGTSSVGEFIFHPGNFNASNFADFNDANDLITHLRAGTVPAPGLPRPDIDRSGKFTIFDLYDLMNLLNGADAYQKYDGTAKPTRSTNCQ